MHIMKTLLSQIYCRGELSEEEKGAYKWWLFDVSECDDDTSDAERSVQVESVLSRLLFVASENAAFHVIA